MTKRILETKKEMAFRDKKMELIATFIADTMEALEQHLDSTQALDKLFTVLEDGIDYIFNEEFKVEITRKGNNIKYDLMVDDRKLVAFDVIVRDKQIDKEEPAYCQIREFLDGLADDISDEVMMKGLKRFLNDIENQK